MGSRWLQIWQIYPPCYWHLVVKMSANLADIPPKKTTTIASGHHGISYYGRCTPGSHFGFYQEKVGISFYFWIIRVVNRWIQHLVDGCQTSIWSRWVQIWQIYPYIYPQSWHLVARMSSNLADLLLDLLADLHPQYWHLVIKMSSDLADLPPNTDILWSRWVQIW